tara:strand:- start:69 stop:287 length:219 start_codon:yes stop_codon:yes gene_type:complete
MDEKKIIKIISKAIKKNVSLKSASSNIEEWDSLAHLSILSALDKATKGASSQINLAEADSVKKIISKLKKIK